LYQHKNIVWNLSATKSYSIIFFSATSVFQTRQVYHESSQNAKYEKHSKFFLYNFNFMMHNFKNYQQIKKKLFSKVFIKKILIRNENIFHYHKIAKSVSFSFCYYEIFWIFCKLIQYFLVFFLWKILNCHRVGILSHYVSILNEENSPKLVLF
jgi:hypothetical protein